MNKSFVLIVCITVTLQGSDQYDDVKMNRLWSEQQTLFNRVISYDCLYKKIDKKYQYYLWKNVKIDQELSLYKQFQAVHQRAHKDQELLKTTKDIFLHKIQEYNKQKNDIHQRRAVDLSFLNAHFAMRRKFLLDFNNHEEAYDFFREEQTFLFNRSLQAVMRREKKFSGLILTFDLYAS
jgi:hypothetical protein